MRLHAFHCISWMNRSFVDSSLASSYAFIFECISYWMCCCRFISSNSMDIFVWSSLSVCAWVCLLLFVTVYVFTSFIRLHFIFCIRNNLKEIVHAQHVNQTHKLFLLLRLTNHTFVRVIFISISHLDVSSFSSFHSHSLYRCLCCMHFSVCCYCFFSHHNSCECVFSFVWTVKMKWKETGWSSCSSFF